MPPLPRPRKIPDGMFTNYVICMNCLKTRLQQTFNCKLEYFLSNLYSCVCSM